MDTERWRRIEELCHDAASRDGAARAAFLAEACGDDVELRREVESLLAEQPGAEAFLATGAWRRPALAPGTRLGPYEILSAVGSGGMGEVYRAHDSKLDRDVAIKILPEVFAADPERVARFEREAKTLAALNHPHIAQIYGLEESTGASALVMELVEGPTLADRIAQGPIPLAEAVPLAKQIAEALEAAHELGIVHRDLKPSNVKVRVDGTVKVLDFGLAKALGPAATGGTAAAVSESPTITSPAAMTARGVILGTAAYMPPEQAKGQTVDKRADVWSFGCVLFEMLTGRRAFPGDDVSDTLASVLKSEPEWSALPRGTPAAIRRLLRRCLAKDLRQRLDSVRDARLELDDALAEPPVEAPRTLRTGIAWREVAFGAVTATIVVGAAASWLAGARNVGEPPRVTRLAITPADPATLAPYAGTAGTARPGRNVAISPDGRLMAYVGNGGSQLFLRPMDRLETVPVEGVQSPQHPFFSPDGAWLGFFDSPSTIKKVPAGGGAAVKVASFVGLPRGASWGRDNTIVFATSDTTTGIWKVPSAGGEPTVVTTPDRTGGGDHVWPAFLPDGRTVLFTIWAGRPDDSTIAAVDLLTGGVTSIVRGGVDAHYASSGHLVFASAGGLSAAPFDLSRRSVVGAAIPVIQPVIVTRYGGGLFDLSTDGTLVYASEAPYVEEFSLVWVTRAGQEEPIDAPPHRYRYPRLSPDGTRVALDVREGGADLWIWEFARHVLTRLTFGPNLNEHPTWTNDSRRLIFTRGPLGSMNLFWQAADGTGSPERLTEALSDQRPYSVSPDGRWLSLRQDSETQDLMRLELSGSHQVEPLVQTRSNESNGDISPDGRWLVFQSDETGVDQVYVRPLPDTSNGQWQISVGGGCQPMWSPTGREIFFRALDGAMMSASVEPGSSWQSGALVKLFDGDYFFGGSAQGWTYDVSRDGQRFIMIKPAPGATAPPSIVIVQHWFEELKRLVPTRAR